MSVWLDFDVSYEDRDHLNQVEEICCRHGADIHLYNRHGPGGGNPNFIVEAPDMGEAVALMLEVYGGGHMGGDGPDDIRHYVVARPDWAPA